MEGRMVAEALLCLSLNVYFESAPKEPLEGQLAVAFVQRTRAVNNGTSVCWETFRDGQFSWTNNTQNLRSLPSPNDEKWRGAQEAALAVMNGATDFTQGATHYHAVGTPARWRRDRCMKKIAVWGSHVFYRCER